MYRLYTWRLVGFISHDGVRCASGGIAVARRLRRAGTPPARARGEILVFWGRSGPGVTVRLFTNLRTGTWTILRVLGSSIARIEDGGRDARQDVGH
jgi:hypothetical protein